MKLENMTISLEEFIKYLIGKWKVFGCVVILCTALFCGTAMMFGEEISVPHSEEYLFYEDALERHLIYVDEAVLMTLDPLCIYERSLFLKNITDKELLKDYTSSSEIWDELQTDRVKKYLPELLTWNENEETGSVELVLRHGTSEDAIEWAEYLAEQLKNYDENLDVIIGAERIVADEDVELEQLRRYTRTEHIKSLWLDSRAGYTIRVSIPVAAVTGVLAGAVLSIVIVLFEYMFKNKNIKRY